jgi:WD40 repeat protein
VFFGRDHEIGRLLELLQPTLQRRAGRFVAVVGPSGSGKSSLLRAGLLPRLERLHSKWVVLPALVPGQQPTRNLAYCLAAAFAARGQQQPAGEIAAVLRRGGAGLVDLADELGELVGAAVPGGAADGRINVLVVIDQAEELLTRTGVREQQAFLSLLREALGDGSAVWVVATVRSEFLSTAPERAGLAEVVDDTLVIEPLSRARLPIVIQQPAQRAGLQFAHGLVEQMVEETTGGDALPLLAYMLRELYQQAGADGNLTIAEYQELGGVVGALQSRANRLTDELTRRGRGGSVLPTLTKFAVVEGDAEPTSRRIPRSALGPEERQVADAFVEARLLTSSVDADGETVIGVAHEALLRQWRPLRDAIEASRASLRVRSNLERLASDWDQGGRDDSYLPGGARLSTFDEWAVDHSSEVGPLERQFMDAAKALASKQLEAAQRSNRRLRALTALLTVLVLAIGLVAFMAIRASQTVSQQRDIAVSRQLIREGDDLGAVDPETARLKSLAAWRIHPSDDARLAMVVTASLPGIAVMTGHTAAVKSVALSPDGRTLASGSDDHSVRLWDVATHRQLGSPLTAQPNDVYFGLPRSSPVAFSPDGKTLAIASGEKSVRLWDVARHRQLGRPLTGHTDAVSSVAFSPDGKTLASGSWDKSVRLWNVASHHQLGSPVTGHTDGVNSVAFSPDGRTLASGSLDESVRLWNVASHRQIGSPLTGHTDPVNSVAFSPDGRTLATGSDDKSVRLWNVASHRQVGSPLPGHTAAVISVVFSPDGRTLASGSDDKSVRLWDVAIGRLLGPPVTGRANAVKSAAFSPDGRTLASGSSDRSVRLWDVGTGRLVGSSLIDYAGDISSMAFSSDGKTLATGGQDKSVRLWDVVNHRELGLPLTGHTAAVNSVAFSPDNKTLASVSFDNDNGSVRLWDTASHQQRVVYLADPLQPFELGNVAFSPDGKTLAIGGMGFRAPTGDRRLEGSEGFFGSIWLWDVANQHEIAPALTGHTDVVNSVAFSPDGKTLASGSSDSTVRLWDVASHRQVGTPLIGHTHPVNSVAFSPDGKTLATGSDDNTVRLWDVASHRQVGYLLAGQTAYSLAFSSDGKTLAAGGDSSVRLWNVPQLADPASFLCKFVGQSLARGEWRSLVPEGPKYRPLCP